MAVRHKAKRRADPKEVLKIKEVLNQGKARSKLKVLRVKAKANPRDNLRVKANSRDNLKVRVSLRASPHKEAALQPPLPRY